MNSEQIKQTTTMREVLDRYGIVPNRAGFICCPFHKEKTASMKIYRNSFYCFGCAVGGDVFKFVELMDNLSFKEAYLSLGGKYDKQPDKFSTMRKIYLAKQKRQKIEKKLKQIKQERKDVSLLIEFWKMIKFQSEPLSEQWCQAVNKLTYLFGKYDYLEGKYERIELSKYG